MALEVGAELELDIHDVAFGGRGVGRHDGCVVFVPGTLTGERVRVRLKKCRKRFAEATLLDVVTPSQHRIAPACPLDDCCPGCSYQHVAYAEEVRCKQVQLEGLLKRIGGVEDVTFRSPMASPRELGYRNKIVLHAQRERKLGYYGHDNRTVVDVPACPLAVPPINAALRERRKDQRFMKGLRPNAAVTFRWTETDGVVDWVERDTGSDRLMECSSLGEIQVPRQAFFQVNPEAGARLLSIVCDEIEAAAPTYCLDLFSGVGLFALGAAQRGVPHVLGVERQPAAIRAAKQNAKALGVTVDFVNAGAEAVVQEALNSVEAAETLVIVDPPRNGLPKALVQTLLVQRPARLVYISCAADTLARDLKDLTADGYAVAGIQLVDMFPRTPHFETVVMLQKKAP